MKRYRIIEGRDTFCEFGKGWYAAVCYKVQERVLLFFRVTVYSTGEKSKAENYKQAHEEL